MTSERHKIRQGFAGQSKKLMQWEAIRELSVGEGYDLIYGFASYSGCYVEAEYEEEPE